MVEPNSLDNGLNFFDKLILGVETLLPHGYILPVCRILYNKNIPIADVLDGLGPRKSL